MAESPLFSLHLLGPFAAQRHDDGPKPNLSRKTRALLAYLAATGQAHSRRSLYEMFCADSQDPAGALRWHLSRIRRMVGAESLLVEGDLVRFNHERGWVDSHEFSRLLDQTEGNWSTIELNHVLTYYRDEFLAELNIQGAASFEFWLLSERSRYQQLFERGLRVAIKRNLDGGSYNEALTQTQRLLQSNPLLEEGHAFLMQLYAQTGRREAALTQFEHCRQLLATELAVEPSADLAALYGQIKEGQHATWGRPVLPNLPLPLLDEVNGVTLVGRDEQLAQLQGAWQRSQPVMVSGVAGAGKSALVESFAAHLSQAKLLRGDCYESTRSMPYRPWIDIIEQFLAIRPGREWEAPQSYWLDQLATVSPILAALRTQDPAKTPIPSSQQHLFSAFAELLLQTADVPPLLIFIDDLQWADESSMQLLQFLAHRLRRPGGNAIMLVATYRSEEVRDNPLLPMVLRDLGRSTKLLEIDLPPLDAYEVDELISQIWPELPLGFRTPHVRDRLLEATAGNPLFLTEILRELAGEGMLPDEVPIPPGLQELVERRMGQLADSGRQVAEALAVLEQPANLALIQQVSGRSEDEVAEALDTSLRWHLVRTLVEAPAGRYDFTHDLMRSAVKERMSEVRKQLLHRRAAEALSRRATAAASIAYHWQQAADRDEEARWWRKAGDEAARIYANADAERYYLQARQLTNEAVEQAEIDWLIASTHLVSSRWADAMSLLEQAEAVARQADDRILLGRVRQRQGNIMALQGRYDEALATFFEAKTYFAAAGMFREQAEIAGSVGSVYWRQSQYDQALAAMEQKLEIAEELRDLRQQSEAYGGIASILNNQGEFDGALAKNEQALKLAQQLNDPHRVGKIQGNMGINFARMLDYGKAVEYFLLQFNSDHSLGDLAGAANSVGNMGTVYRMFGHFGLARACAKQQLHVSLALNDRRGMAVALGDIGASYLDDEQPSKALEILARAVAMAKVVNDPFLLCSYRHFQSQSHHLLGEYDQAVALMGEALGLAREINRLDVLWLAELHDVIFRHDAGLLSRDEAIASLEEQLQAVVNERIAARLKYEIWRLDGTRQRYRNEALISYQLAYERSPEHMLKRPLETMLGEPTKTAMKLPPLPKEVFVQGESLENLLHEFDALLPAILADQ